MGVAHSVEAEPWETAGTAFHAAIATPISRQTPKRRRTICDLMSTVLQFEPEPLGQLHGQRVQVRSPYDEPLAVLQSDRLDQAKAAITNGDIYAIRGVDDRPDQGLSRSLHHAGLP